MKGRIKRRLAEQREVPMPAPTDEVICPLCERPIPPAQRDAHHLVPKSRGGVHTQWLHRICHRHIHALFTETELARSYHTVEQLLAHPDMARFVAWVQRKPPDFFQRTSRSGGKGTRGADARTMSK